MGGFYLTLLDGDPLPSACWEANCPLPRACWQTKPPPVSTMTDRCKNIALPQTSFRVVIVYCIYFNHKLSVNQLTHLMYCDGEVAPPDVSSIILRLVDYRPCSHPEPIPIHTRSGRLPYSYVINRIHFSIRPPHPLGDTTGIDLYVTWTATKAGRFLVQNLNKNYTI